jgi:hypothetical protein
MNQLLFLLLLTSTCLASRACQPLAPRMFYGDSISNPSSTRRLSIYFNTNRPCLGSHLQLLTKGGKQFVSCQTTSLRLSSNMSNYQTHIHKCHTDLIQYEETFRYRVFGWDGSERDPISSGDLETAKLADPFNVLPILLRQSVR